MSVVLRKDRRYIVLFLLVWLGFEFLPKSLLMLLWLGSIALYGWYSWKNRKEISFLLKGSSQATTTMRVYKTFWMVALLWLIVSFFNLPEIWSLKTLPFECSYIPRHFIVVFELFLPVGFGYALYKTDFVYRIPDIFLVLVAVFGLIIHHIPYVFLTVGSITLLAYKKSCMMLLPLTLFANLEQSAPIMGALLLIILSLNRKTFSNFLSSGTKRKLFSIILILGFCIALFYSSFIIVLEGDSNTLWRWRVWENEYHSLMATNFMGVGFGSAYVSYDIVDSVDNYNMYKSEDGSIYDGLFLVANHNSFLNMFYRMGVLGGSLFLILLFQLIRWTISSYRHADKEMKLYIWCAFVCFADQVVIALFNPGLEMMQFAVGFWGSISFLIATLFKQCAIDIHNRGLFLPQEKIRHASC